MLGAPNKEYLAKKLQKENEDDDEDDDDFYVIEPYLSYYSIKRVCYFLSVNQTFYEGSGMLTFDSICYLLDLAKTWWNDDEEKPLLSDPTSNFLDEQVFWFNESCGEGYTNLSFVQSIADVEFGKFLLFLYCCQSRTDLLKNINSELFNCDEDLAKAYKLYEDELSANNEKLYNDYFFNKRHEERYNRLTNHFKETMSTEEWDEIRKDDGIEYTSYLISMYEDTYYAFLALTYQETKFVFSSNNFFSEEIPDESNCIRMRDFYSDDSMDEMCQINENYSEFLYRINNILYNKFAHISSLLAGKSFYFILCKDNDYSIKDFFIGIKLSEPYILYSMN